MEFIYVFNMSIFVFSVDDQDVFRIIHTDGRLIYSYIHQLPPYSILVYVMDEN